MAVHRYLVRVFVFAGYLYLIRVPLLIWIAMLALSELGSPSGSVLPGIFDVSQPGTSPWLVIAQFAIVSLAAGMTYAALGITSRLIVRNAHDRFGVQPLHFTPGIELLFRMIPFWGAFFLCLAAVHQSQADLLPMLTGLAVGGFLFWFIIQVLQGVIWDRYVVGTSAKRPEKWMAVLLWLMFVTAFVCHRPQWGILVALMAAPVSALIWRGKRVVTFLRNGHWIPGSRAGYFRGDHLQDRHLFAFFQFGFSLWVYALYFVFKFSSSAGPPLVPTLSLVLLLFMLICWALSGLSFFVDLYRVPVLLFMLAYAFVVSSFPQGDHFYRGLPGPGHDDTHLSPKDVLTKGGANPIVLVSTTGGGIQAAAWTARVLTGLSADNETEGFDRRVRLISAVSGGSVGAMMFLAEYQGGHLRDSGPPDHHRSVVSSEASSLDQLTWGLAYPDLLFGLAPMLKLGPLLTVDRGSALEHSWAQQMGPPLDHATLWQWRWMANQGLMPSVIFNSTYVETGNRFLLSTTDFDRKCRSFHEDPPQLSADRYARHVGREEFRNKYCGSDVSIVTAARLSATFPFVSPAARILRAGESVEQPELHAVDGGYYDNYGMATLLDWLDQALSENNGSKQPLLIVEIRSSATAAPGEPARQGWTLQTLNPLLTMWNVRGTSQLSRNELEYEILRSRYPNVRIEHAVFEFNRLDGRGDHREDPLNWHLTPDDKQALRDEWNQEHQDCRKKVKEFLEGKWPLEACAP